MLSLLNLLGDPTRGSNLELPEIGRSEADGESFDSLFAVAAGFFLQPQPVPDGEPVSGTALPQLPAQRQRLAEALTATQSHAAVEPSMTTKPAEASGAVSTAGVVAASDEAPTPPATMESTQARVTGRLPTGHLLGTASRTAGTPAGALPAIRPEGLAVPGRLDPSAPTLEAETDRAPAPNPARPGLAPAFSTPEAVRAALGNEQRNGILPVTLAPDEGAAEGSDGLPPAGRPSHRRSASSIDPTLATSTERAPVVTPSTREPAAAALSVPYIPAPRALQLQADGDAVRSARDTVRSPIDLPAAASGPGALPEAARVRQAAEVMRQWSARAAAAEAVGSEAAAVFRHAPATAAALPAVTQTTAAAPSGEPATLSLNDSQAAAEQLVQRVLQGQARQMSIVRFQLSPAELGQMQVQMLRRGNRMEIAFTTTHAAARDLIETCLPHLRGLLQDVGIQLADVDVRHEAPARDLRGGSNAGAHQDGGRGQQQAADGSGRHGSRGGAGGMAPQDHAAPAADAIGAQRPGGIDAFA